MKPDRVKGSPLTYRPLTPEVWADFEALFGPKGAYAGCWCMWWRSTRAEFARQQGEGNRKAMRALVRRGEVPGILGYLGGAPVAWCSIAPRERFASLERSRVLKRLDDLPVWAIVCFFVSKAHRGQGLSLEALRAAVHFARTQGATIIEAYPAVPKRRELPPVSSFMGIPHTYAAAGFEEVARPSASRIIMRCSMG
jgi:GNAT superfamily N-acetyltransferase